MEAAKVAYFESFSTTTVIRVFHFIRTSRYLVERLFWIVVLIGFSGTTVWDVTRTFSTFLAEPTASQVSFVFARSLRFPNALFCMQMQSDILLNLYEQRIDEIIAEIQNGSDVVQRLRQKLEKIHKAEDDKITKLVESTKNSTSLQSASSQLGVYHKLEQSEVDILTQNEIGLLALTTTMFVRLIDLETNTRPYYAEWQSRAVAKLFEAYIRNYIDFGALLNLTTELTCALMQIRVSVSTTNPITGVNNLTAIDFCKRFSFARWFGFLFAGIEMVCYHVAQGHETPFVFSTQFDFVTMSMHPETLYTESSGAELEYIFVDFEGTLATQQQALAPRFGDKQTVEFSIEAESTTMNLRRRGCSEMASRQGTFTDCIMWCRLESIVRACDCMPVIRHWLPEFSKLYHDLKGCSMSLGVSNFSQHQSGDPKCRSTLSDISYGRVNCTQHCKPNCETFLLASTTRSSDASLAYLNASTVVNLVSTDFVYQKVDEYLTMDAKALVASLGGNLSLYLGASFIALIHIVVFFVKLPFEVACHISSGAKTADATNSFNNEELKRMVRSLVNEEVLSLRQQVRRINRRLEVAGVDRKLMRGAHLLGDGQLF